MLREIISLLASFRIEVSYIQEFRGFLLAIEGMCSLIHLLIALNYSGARGIFFWGSSSKKDKYGVLAVLWLLVSEILECMSEQNLLRSASWKYRKQKCFLNFFFKHEKTHVIPGLSFQVPQEKVIGWLFLVSTASAHVIAMIVMKQFQRRSDWMIGFGKYNKCKRWRNF